MEKLTTPEVKDEFSEIIDLANSAYITVHESLNASNDKVAKEEFLSDPNLEHPNNEYGNLDEAEIEKNLTSLDKAKNILEVGDIGDKRKRLANLIIDEYEKMNDFLAANLVYNRATTKEEKRAAAEVHKKTNEALYGKPDEDTFYALLGEKIEQIDKDNLSPEDLKIYEKLLADIGPIKHIKIDRFKPKPETVEEFSRQIKIFFENFLKYIPEDKNKFSSEEVVGIMNDILSNEFGGMDVKYRAIVDPKVSNASVNYEEFQIKFPENKEYSADKAKALIVHELGTHAYRAIPYLNSGIKAFTEGLPGNETFDDGIAKCVEQAIKGEYEDSGIDHYINIGLANFKGKNFREVYDIQMALKHLTGEESDTVLNAVQRCFRGTGELPNNKDLMYYNGANQVWQYIEEHIDDPELLFDNLFLTGKANITDPVQEALSYEMRTGGI